VHDDFFNVILSLSKDLFYRKRCFGYAQHDVNMAFIHHAQRVDNTIYFTICNKKYILYTKLSSLVLYLFTNMTNDKITVLYVDDEKNNLIAFKAEFRDKYTVYTALNGFDGLKILEQHDVHVILTDQRMPRMTGVEFLEKVIEKHPLPIRILVTGYSDMSAIISAINKGQIFHYINKPWDEEELEETIDKAYHAYLEKKKMIEENEELYLTNSQLEFLLRQRLLS